MGEPEAINELEAVSKPEAISELKQWVNSSNGEPSYQAVCESKAVDKFETLSNG